MGLIGDVSELAILGKSLPSKMDTPLHPCLSHVRLTVVNVISKGPQFGTVDAVPSQSLSRQLSLSSS